MTRFSPGFLGRGGTTTWNPADKTAGVTLSNLNRKATFANTGEVEAVRSIASNASGKAYFEITPPEFVFPGSGGGTGGTSVIGFASAGHIMKDYLGSDSLSIGWIQNGQVFVRGAIYEIEPMPWYGTIALGIAVDFGAKLVWFRSPTGDWNATTGDPEFNYGGIPCGITGPMFAAAMNVGGSSLDANFGGAPFTYPVPAGFGPGLT